MRLSVALPLLALVGASCRPEAPTADAFVPAFAGVCRLEGEGLAALRARAARRFAKAVFLKPGESELLDPYLAPLVYLEEAENAGPEGWVRPFGTVVHDASGVRVDTARPALYVARRTTRLQGFEARQDAFAMVFAGADGAGPRVQAVRHTWDDRGALVCVEAYRDRSALRILYVAHRVEEAARAEFGAPLPGRTHVVEPSPLERPDVAVVRILKDPAAPLGPYAYLCAEERELLTFHCRCSPSQVDEVTRQLEYELVPFDRLAAVHTPELDALRAWLDEPSPGPNWLELDLRLPKAW